MDWTDRLVRSDGAFISWSSLLEAVYCGAGGIAVGELARQDAEYLRRAARIIDVRLDEQDARGRAGKDGG